jgi:hypothetical protein
VRNDLFMGFVQRIEGVEEFLLDALLAGEELDVVNEENIDLAIFLAEAWELAVLEAVDVFVGELLGGNVSDARNLFVRGDVLSNGVEQVRLAEAGAAVKRRAGCRICQDFPRRPWPQRARDCWFRPRPKFSKVFLGLKANSRSRVL